MVNWYANTCRVAIAVAFGAAAVCTVAGEKVIFSKPDAPIASPIEKRGDNLPERPADIRDFQTQQPQVVMPYIPQPVNRPDPRKNDTRKNDRPTIFDEPALFSDPDAREIEAAKKDQERNSVALSSDRNAPTKSFVLPGDPFRRQEPDKALSPIRDYNWNSASAGNERNGKPEEERSSMVSRWDNDRSIFAKPRQNEEKGLVGSIFGFLSAAQKRELTPEQMDQRMQFEKLLNANYSPLGPKDPIGYVSSGAALEPVKPQAPPAALMTIQGPSLAERRSLDPMHTLNEQHRSLRGPNFDELNKKAFSMPGSAPAAQQPNPSPLDRKPLMAQPTFQDFPGRRF